MFPSYFKNSHHIITDIHSWHYVCACLHVRMFLIVGQMAGPIWAKLGTWIHLDLGSVSIKSTSKVECQRQDKAGAVVAKFAHCVLQPVMYKMH